ncbi:MULTISPECIES: glycerol kinase GlpK [Halomonas]|uniref:Glycerol kinase n=1 Tax=Halomonas halophila TaxID=29573 RepID=A0ABQ0U2C3_9GAMM|nr:MULTISPECIES: glycerol kinase GlpK [Halomonas]MDR5888234.1 glycerol kinase GlpK [Halomonas salina]RAH36793.1 glycerol kinase [Halomonas sp. SL1]WJY08751.1 glycerol kinase GlpK [Halomonas halophila]GEK72582.1 glycerol kinase 1 [Halomonas halophila]
MASYLLAIDQGTTSSRAILFDRESRGIAMAQSEFPQRFPADGWVEHDPEAIWESVLATCREVIAEQGVAIEEIAGIGITNQRETTLLWDRETGKPLHDAIVWQDRRTAEHCQRLRDAGHAELVQARTGLLIDPYFSATKLAWLLDNVEGARERAERGELAFGTVDTFLIWRLTGGRVHATDATNASRTALFDIHSQRWDPDLMALFDIPASLLPEVKDSSDDFGRTDAHWFGGELPIAGVAGDQQAALVGQACFRPGMGKSTYGTGCFMIVNTGERAEVSRNRLLTTVGYRLNGVPTYAMEGSIFVAGATVQWLRDGLKLFADASETESLARETKSSNSVYLVPAFTGLGAPHWDPKARGAILGLTRDTGIADIVAAGLQAVCYQTRDLQVCMSDDMRTPPGTLRVDGGMVVNGWVMQFLADMLGVQVDRPGILETTALGAAYLAGLRLGWYRDLEEIAALWQSERSFFPSMEEGERERLYSGWLEAVERVRCDPEGAAPSS